MIRRRAGWGVAAAIAVLIAHGVAHAYSEMDTEADRRERARLIGVVEGTQLRVSFEGAPAREAFRAVGKALGVSINGRWADDRIGHGIDPEIEIWLDIDRADARFILEMMLEQCEDYEPCTWQLRPGCVVVGTKERLSAPSARQTRMYSIRELMIEAPYFAAGGGPSVSRSEFMERKYATAVLSVPDPDGRKRPEELALEIVHGIVETVEPGNWDTGEPVEPDDDVEVTAPRGAGGRPARRRIVQDWKIARIRQYRGQVIITAPDFVHRQVGGYPQKIVPTPLTDAARETRSAQASAHDAITITVLAPGEEMSE